MVETRSAANTAFDLFLEKYGAKYPKATDCLAKDQDELLAFYDFPAEHWKHLRTTNPIESTFATVRLCHRRTKGSAAARPAWRWSPSSPTTPNGTGATSTDTQLIPEVLAGRRFIDGIIETTRRDAA